MDVDDARFLAGPEGQALLAQARALRTLPPHRRRRAIEGRAEAARLRAVLAQDDLRREAAARCPFAEDLLFTREALAQASAWPVAEERAGRWPGPAEAPLVDLGAGVGLDALAAARAGRPVEAWERDPARALLLRHNARALGLEARVEVVEGDVLAGRPRGGLAFLDPGRRPGGRRTRDPERFEPPQGAWADLLAPFEAAMVKVGPVAPPGEEERLPFEVVSLGGRLRERRLFFGAFGPLPPRRALSLPSGRRVEGEGLPWPAPADPAPGLWLLDPDPAVTVAGLVGDLAAGLGLSPLNPRIAYLLGERPLPRAPGHWVHLEARLPARPGAIDAWLAAQDVGSLTIRARGIAEGVETWRRRLHPRGRGRATVVLTRDRRDRRVALVGREPEGLRTSLPHPHPVTRE